ncbi:hypothetical protein ACSAGD_11460 [Paramicrobacterium sp. CJ85]|uniref:hypothetical protein n=1 Tax=Paramicrobacterium sp. CJ85 TaxID=3445355 RepID=UPI003F609E1C
MSDALRDRCEELRAVVLELTTTTIEAMGKPSKLADVVTVIGKLRAIGDKGAAGIDNPDYLAWDRVYDASLQKMEDAARRGDAQEAWRAFADQETGVNLIARACTGYPGW